MDGACSNFGVEWDVTYEGELVTISNVEQHSSESPVERRDLSVTMAAVDYRAEIAAFCREVLAFAEAHPRDNGGDQTDAADWSTWQKEIRDRLAGGTTRFAPLTRHVDSGIAPATGPIATIVERTRGWFSR